jgi:hypothetical protein
MSRASKRRAVQVHMTEPRWSASSAASAFHDAPLRPSPTPVQVQPTLSRKFGWDLQGRTGRVYAKDIWGFGVNEYQNSDLSEASRKRVQQ